MTINTKSYCILCCIVTLMIICLYMGMKISPLYNHKASGLQYPTEEQGEDVNNTKFLVDGVGCSIPKLDAFHIRL